MIIRKECLDLCIQTLKKTHTMTHLESIEQFKLGCTVATIKGLGIVIGFAQVVGSLLVELETGETIEFLYKEIEFLSK